MERSTKVSIMVGEVSNRSPSTYRASTDRSPIDLNLLLRDVAQDVCNSTNPTQEKLSYEVMQIIRLPPGNMS